MLRPRWLQALRFLGLEFWLLLPFLGLVFWSAGGLVTDQLLSRGYKAATRLEANPQPEAPSKTVRAIKAEIRGYGSLSIVTVKTADSARKELEFEFVATDLGQVEAGIAQKLGLSVQQVRKLVRYRMQDRDSEANDTDLRGE